MRNREEQQAGNALSTAARSRRADVETRKIVDAVTRQMGLEPDPLGAAEDTLCNILNAHGYQKALDDFRALEERLLFHGADVPDAEMMERIYFLHVVIDCVKELATAEKEVERKVAPVRKN